MSSIMVLESLMELFPQVDNRILKAASIEHANNLDAAVEFILLDVIPYIPTKLPQNDNKPNEMDGSSTSNHWRASSVRSNSSYSNGGAVNLNELDESQHLYNSIVNSAPPKRNNNNINNDINSSLRTEIISQSSNSSSASLENRNWDLSVLVANNKLANKNGENEANGSNGSNDIPSFESDMITQSSHSVNTEFLEDFVSDAKNNKMNLVGSVETLTKMLREVVQLEERAKNVKEEGLSAGQETLKKVEELREMLIRAKETNEMHSGEVYGERSILSTEAREFQSRLVCLSEEKNKSLEIIDEIRLVLEARVVAAEEEIARAEKEKIEKENSAKEALKEQEDLMNIVVEESKKLKQEAEGNSKLREFLVDRGRIVDALQGEISVICEDITKLKKIVDGNIPLSKSMLSTMSSLSSSTFSSFSLHKSTCSSLSERETTQLERKNEIPNGGKRSSPNSSSDSWDLFEKEEVES